MIYSGIPYPDPQSLGQTGATVLKLMKDFIGKGYTAYPNNFYNSVNLTKYMSSNGTYICGTLTADTKNNPKEVVRKKPGMGEMVWAPSKTAVLCNWKDKRDVWKISNKHKSELVRVTDRRGKEKMKPNIVADYNLGMFGIDRSDQMLSYYQGLHKTVRWYKETGFHFLEIYMHNVFHLFKCHQPQSSTVLIDFRIDVVKSLLQFTGNPRINIDPNVTVHYLSYQMMGIKKKICFDAVLATRKAYIVRHVPNALSVKINHHYSVAPCFCEFHENN